MNNKIKEPIKKLSNNSYSKNKWYSGKCTFHKKMLSFSSKLNHFMYSISCFTVKETCIWSCQFHVFQLQKHNVQNSMIITYSEVIIKYQRILEKVKRGLRVAIILKNGWPRNRRVWFSNRSKIFCIILFDQISSVVFTLQLFYFRSVILLFFLYCFIC